MGTTTSSARQQQLQYQSSHEKFKIMSIDSQNNEMTLTIPFQQQSDIKKWELKLKEIESVYNEFLLFPLKHQISQKGLCGSSGLIKITYEYFPYVLEEQINNRAQSLNYFEQAELWYLLYVLISNSVQFNKLNSKVGDIRPHNIFINQNGQIKIANLFSWPNQVNNFQKTNFDKTLTYLSPQQFQQIRSNKGKNKNTQKNIINQSFSIGLTILHAAMLKSQQDLYNFKKYQFQQKKLEVELEQWKKFQFWSNQHERKLRYSNEFKNVIKGLLLLQPNNRIKSTQLFQLLRPNDEEILNLKPFDYPKLILHGEKVQSAYIAHNQSPKLSSIKKKEFNQFDSIGLQMSYGPKQSKILKFDEGSSGVRIKNIDKKQQNKKIESVGQFKQKLPVESGYKIIHPIHPRRAGSKSRKTIQEDNPNNSPIKKAYFTGEVPSNNYTYSQINRFSNPVITSSISSSYTTSVPQVKFNHMTFNPSSNPNFINQPTIYQNNFGINQTNSIYTMQTSSNNNMYSIAPSNVNLTTSGYTYLNKTEPIYSNNISSTYVQSQNPDKLQFLKKIDEQLNKSRNMFPS